MPIFRAKFSVLPGAVRNHEVEEFPFFRRRLGLEQQVGPLRQFEKLDPLVDIVLVSDLMRLHVAQETALHGAPFGGFGVEEVTVDPAVQLIQVHGIDAVL
ncbi:MAG: hypothetical protein ACE141_14060 [Bryobacteraceae bacterium]